MELMEARIVAVSFGEALDDRLAVEVLLIVEVPVVVVVFTRDPLTSEDCVELLV